MAEAAANSSDEVVDGSECLDEYQHYCQNCIDDKETSFSVCKNPTNVTARHIADINVRAKSDAKDCSITGSAVLSSNRVIITDFENNRIKMLDTSTHKLISEMKVPSGPWDVTVIRTNQAAVTLPNRKKIFMLKVTDSLTKERDISVRNKYYGIAYARNELFVTVVDPPRLDIIDMQHGHIRKIEYNRDRNTLFAYPQFLCVSNDLGTIYVADEERGAVMSITVDGRVKSMYRDTIFEKGCGKICTDNVGNIYVCCFGTRKVLVLSADFQKTKVILAETDGLEGGVLSVSHCPETNRLFLGMQNTNILKIYHVS